MRRTLLAALILLAACGSNPEQGPIAATAKDSATPPDSIAPAAGSSLDSTRSSEPAPPCQTCDGPYPNVLLASGADILAAVPSLRLDSTGLLNVAGDTLHEYFATRPFIDSVLAPAKLRSFLHRREQRLSWRGMIDQLYLHKDGDFPVPGATAVRELGNAGLLRFADGSAAFYFTILEPGTAGTQFPQWGPFLLFFDKSGRYRDGFECAASMGNRHGSTQVQTWYEGGGRFHAAVDDWAEGDNPNGFHVSAGLTWNGQRLLGGAYTVRKLE